MSRRKGGHDEEHENHERWLLTYADMITLLMVLFIVMFAMSTVDAKKFDQLKQSLSGAFGGSQIVLSGQATQGTDPDSVAPAAVDLSTNPGGAGSLQATPEQAERAVRDADRAKASRDEQTARAEVESLRAIQKQISDRLGAEGLLDQVRFAIDERGLVVTVLTSSVVFGGDSAALLPAGRRIVVALAPSLVSLPNRIEVGGHTNQLPVPTVNYPSSWELSTARASSVVRVLADNGVGQNRLSAAGFADQRPYYPPSDPRAVAGNRRVEVVVLSTQSAEVRALLPTIANAS